MTSGTLRRCVVLTLLSALTSSVVLSSAGSGVWYDGGRAKLLQCGPRCTVIKEIPFDAPLMVSQDSMYRVVLAGKFKPGQRLKMVMRFADVQLVTLSVTVVE